MISFYFLKSLLAFIIIVALPAYYINKWLLHWLQPRKSILRFAAHILLCLLAGILYAFFFIQLMRILVN